jgi:Fe-S-cluster containining protein
MENRTLDNTSRFEDLPLVDENTRFQCLRCDECCKYEVTLTSEEERVLSAEAGRIGRTLCHLDLNGKCVATTLASGKEQTGCLFIRENVCSVYEKRPVLCRLYPFFPIESIAITAETRDLCRKPISVRGASGKEYFIAYEPECKGIGAGELVDASSIVTQYEKHLCEID